MDAGNNSLTILAKDFQVRPNDKFTTNGFFGFPHSLVTNTCYPTKNVQYFAKIDTLNFADLAETITNVFDAAKRYRDYVTHQSNE